MRFRKRLSRRRSRFVSPIAQFTPKEVETRSEREKLMFRVKVRIDPELLKPHAARVKTGVAKAQYFPVSLICFGVTRLAYP
jgi:hypothetical protein